MRDVSWTDKGLAIGRMWVGDFAKENKWLAAYDFDGDETLTREEMTQGWLIKTAELKTGRTYNPCDLVVIKKVAALELAVIPTVGLKGFRLDIDEERVVRKALEETQAGVELTEAMNKTFEKKGSGGDSGEGSTSGESDTGGGGCFTANTNVLLADGNYKRIADIRIGDWVTSYDFEKNEREANEVVRLFTFDADHILNINGLEVTETHPFAVGDDEWVGAGEFKVGDKLIGDGLTAIERMERRKGEYKVFNMTVDGTHNYYVAD